MFNSYKDIGLNWLKENNTKIFFFGLGFIQIKINDEYRLHLYHPSLPAFVEQPHTHRYNFTSTILKGQFTQHIYNIEPNEAGTYWLTYESCGRGELPEEQANYKVSIESKLLLSNTYKIGSSYTISKEAFHTVEADNCITLLKRGTQRDDYAKVLSLKEEAKLCPFSKKIEESQLWYIVEEMLNE